MKSGKLAIITAMVLLSVSCYRKQEKKVPEDTPSSGSIRIAADESFRPLVEEEVKTFMALYPEATVLVDFLPESEVSRKLLDDSSRLVILPRKMNEIETSYFEEKKIPVQQIRMGTDALAFISNPENPDSTLTYQQVVDILSGKILKWSELDRNNPDDSILVVFDQRKSSTLSFLQQQILKEVPLTPRAFALDSVQAVKQYVEQQKRAIGVVDVSWISDRSAEGTQQFLNGIHVMAISHPDSSNQDVFYQPTRYNMLYWKYPFRRDLYLILNEGRLGLGTGFANFVMNEQGQMIVHHFGLVAAKQPVRVIELKNEF
ncbi:MAG: substrate-binding domain-containing protein [Chitinophagales bacterium]|nr:substrate-binding domain-containing protein [Chitinophagales bacterium]